MFVLTSRIAQSFFRRMIENKCVIQPKWMNGRTLTKKGVKRGRKRERERERYKKYNAPTVDSCCISFILRITVVPPGAAVTDATGICWCPGCDC